MAADPEPPHGDVQDTDMTGPPLESDSDDDEPQTERSEEIQEFERFVAEYAGQFGVLGESEVVTALQNDSLVLSLAADNAAAEQDAK
eukprot:14339213-Alexandrium_andersonii.AAC.1